MSNNKKKSSNIRTTFYCGDNGSKWKLRIPCIQKLDEARAIENNYNWSMVMSLVKQPLASA